MEFNDISVDEYIKNQEQFSVTFDVRSPLEFDESHIPNSKNLYALTNDERVEIGTLHSRTPFEAKLLGASFVCKNLSFHLQNFSYTPADKIAIYCARGQMRSRSVATVLSAIGFRVYRIVGGYKSYRQEVLRFFENLQPYKLLVIDGSTGSGKSEVVRSIDWSIDLESFAGHRGSVFGGVGIRQNSQKMFENLLMDRLVRSNGALLVESESKRIGKVTIPTSFHNLMLISKRIQLETPMANRVERIVADYKMITDGEFEQAMARIESRIKNSVKDEIRAAFYAKDLAKTAAILLTEYYDHVYKKNAEPNFVVEHKTLKETIKSIERIRSEID